MNLPRGTTAVTLKKTAFARGSERFLSGSSYSGATYGVYVNGVLVGKMATEGHGGRCGRKGSPVFRGTDGSRSYSVSVRGVFRKHLDRAAIAVYEKKKNEH